MSSDFTGRLNKILDRITAEDFLHGKGLGNEIPFYAFDYPTERELEVREHIAFLENAELYHQAGDYYFVHAGVRPGTALEQQRFEDQLWIREPFISSERDHGAVVVHGHTIEEAVTPRPNRIGLDTGAYYTGVLTCLVLEGEQRRLIQTGAE